MWHGYHDTIPRTQRYSLGSRIDTLFIEAIEATSAAAFLSREEKLPYVRHAARKIDALKVLLMMLWELGSLENKKYIAVSEHIDEIGKMLGGWQGQLKKQNSSARTEEK